VFTGFLVLKLKFSFKKTLKTTQLGRYFLFAIKFHISARSKKITQANFQMLVPNGPTKNLCNKAKKTPAHIADVSTLYFPCCKFFFKNKYGRIYRYRKF